MVEELAFLRRTIVKRTDPTLHYFLAFLGEVEEVLHAQH